MPICEIDPWRMQYFAGVACPADVLISTEDSDSWIWYPRHRWVYDKIAVALSQGLEAAPHGVEPKVFPVFSKPITNLKGMGVFLAHPAFEQLAAYLETPGKDGHGVAKADLTRVRRLRTRSLAK